ncbi:helix-turn-helix domain-containing protein [Aquimarina pacifica]|uniref:helix-turn-helix domain-containing protein n=1 Tax=Aquimarina pacifica TaxID=1296415 RepID=UPI00046F593D|nr:AraC family transcriptional regulator [Aquimarina pacifica]
MFLNTQKYGGKLGEIKFSKAKSKSQFQGKTKGLALKYVVEGVENYCLDGVNIPLRKGQFLLLKENEKYEVFFENKRNTIQGICIDLNLDLDKNLVDLYENEILFKTVFNCFTFCPLGNSFQDFSKKENDKMNGLAVLNSISSQLISFSDDLFEMQMRLDFFAKKTETKRILVSKLMVSKDFIYQNYNTKITLNQLSLESGISKFHFSKLFKSCFRKSPLELQEFLRMEKAKKIISTKKMTLTDVAFYLGYSDLAAFSNQFKKHFGASPSSFSKY